MRTILLAAVAASLSACSSLVRDPDPRERLSAAYALVNRSAMTFEQRARAMDMLGRAAIEVERCAGKAPCLLADYYITSVDPLGSPRAGAVWLRP